MASGMLANVLKRGMKTWIMVSDRTRGLVANATEGARDLMAEVRHEYAGPEQRPAESGPTRARQPRTTAATPTAAATASTPKPARTAASARPKATTPARKPRSSAAVGTAEPQRRPARRKPAARATPASHTTPAASPATAERKEGTAPATPTKHARAAEHAEGAAVTSHTEDATTSTPPA